jgi:hypothetical protein
VSASDGSLEYVAFLHFHRTYFAALEVSACRTDGGGEPNSCTELPFLKHAALSSLQNRPSIFSVATYECSH